MTYKLAQNSCNLGVYAKILVASSFSNRYAITGSSPSNASHRDDEGAVIKDCSGLSASGCLVYPGPTAYFNGTNYNHSGNGTYTRTHSPNVTFTYSPTAATAGMWLIQNLQTYEEFRYQFINNTIAQN